jgi:hypothetical protein
MIDVQYVRRPEKGILELAKYVTKGASPAKADVLGGRPGGFMDPRLAVRVEIAFSGDRLIQCYGDWRKMDVDADEPDDDECVEDRELAHAACPHCGLVGDWRTVTLYTDEWLARYARLPDGSPWKPRIGRAGPPATSRDGVGYLRHSSAVPCISGNISRSISSLLAWPSGKTSAAPILIASPKDS